MRSLRRRLFVMLIVATGAIWLAGAAWTYLRTQGEIERVLDRRLEEAARMVNSLAVNSELGRIQTAVAAASAPSAFGTYEHQLACQIWSFDGRLVARSSDAPQTHLSDRSAGFSDAVVNGETWRVYAIEDAATGLRILVGDRLGLRERLVANLIKGLVAPALIVVPLLGLMIWVSLGRGLRPLAAMASDVQGRTADDMNPIDAGEAPVEVRPLAEALNGLFARLAAARRHEREVTAFAAHELRTPLAGLKTQVQVALAAADAGVRENALRQSLVAVDRTTRLVRQLLALAKVDASADAAPTEDVCVGEVLDEIVDALAWAAGERRVDVDTKLHGLAVRANRELLGLALRNLHENAVLHSPAGGAIAWGGLDGMTGVYVEDEGPGIPAAELELVTRRFFRGRHKSESGSGLGLAIVELALRRSGGGLKLINRKPHGLRAEVVLPESVGAAGPRRPDSFAKTTAEQLSAGLC